MSIASFSFVETKDKAILRELKEKMMMTECCFAQRSEETEANRFVDLFCDTVSRSCLTDGNLPRLVNIQSLITNRKFCMHRL